MVVGPRLDQDNEGTNLGRLVMLVRFVWVLFSSLLLAAELGRRRPWRTESWLSSIAR